MDCTPQSCVEMNRECGFWDDGCGTQLDCGGCPGGSSCNNGICVVDCTPQTCLEMNRECGTWDDGCGTQLYCGGCNNDETCIQGSCNTNPVLSLDSQNGLNFTLRWTYQWSGLASTSDHYKLEESTTSSSSGFSVIVQTPLNNRTSPWTEDLTRANGTYYYRVQAITSNGPSGYSNVLTVTVAQQPATIRIVNDLYNQVAGPNDWGQMNQLFRIWIADDYTSIENCTDSCDRLTPGFCGQFGQVVQPNPNGSSWIEFDVSMYADGNYCVYLDCGWWDYFCAPSCCWEEHATTVVCCDGVNTCWKWNTFCVNDHYDGVFTTYASEWLPQGNWVDTQFCQ